MTFQFDEYFSNIAITADQGYLPNALLSSGIINHSKSAVAEYLMRNALQSMVFWVS